MGKALYMVIFKNGDDLPSITVPRPRMVVASGTLVAHHAPVQGGDPARWQADSGRRAAVCTEKLC
jgi:hypothetical protein